jgi:hypothetical protein
VVRFTTGSRGEVPGKSKPMIREQKKKKKKKTIIIIVRENTCIFSINEINSMYRLDVLALRLPSQLYPDMYNNLVGSAMAHAVSHRPVAAEVRIRALVIPCGICGVQSGTGTGIYMSSSVLSCHYHSTVAIYTHMSSGG